MNKKAIVIISILVITLLLFASYKTFLGPKGIEGAKEVTVHIVNENEDVDKTFKYNTDHGFLLELLEEKQEELGATFETSDLGTMVIGMMNYISDPNKQEFFYITINGEEAMTGVGEIPLNDKDTYKFELTNY
ncbi:MAG: DUF4430 domain-containing protein [Tissierellia bacterium]|nr:DUF4430 domain-containing protein [Tissierellia bacterium]